MKKITKLFSLMMAVALLVLVPDYNAMTASAAGTTYLIGYNPEHGGGSWRWQLNVTAFDITKPDDDIYRLMNEHIKDGDTLIIDTTNANDAALTLDVPVRLSNLTVMYSGSAIGVTAKGVDEFYAIHQPKVGIHAPIKNAYVYDGAFVTFNQPVDNLEIIRPGTNYHMIVNSTSTVAHAKEHDGAGYTRYEVWNVASGKFEASNTGLGTNEAFYSKTAVAGTSSAATATTAATNADEYDDVPKTGQEMMPVVLLLGASLVCLAGSRKLRRS